MKLQPLSKMAGVAASMGIVAPAGILGVRIHLSYSLLSSPMFLCPHRPSWRA